MLKTAALPGPNGPAKLDSGDAIAELLVLALKKGQEERFDEAERLMTRLYVEVDPLECRDILIACANEWLKVSGIAPEARQSALEPIARIAQGVGEGRLGPVVSDCQVIIALISKLKVLTAEAFRLQLLLLGVKGAASRVAPAAPSDGVEPKSLESFAAREVLIMLAHGRAVASQFVEAQRLMTRLAKEIPPADLEMMIDQAGDAWLKVMRLPEIKDTEALGLISTAARAAGTGNFRGSYEFFKLVLPLVKPDNDPAIRLMLLSLSVKGASPAA